jgi:DNA-binding XRE family transcriptional regulator
MPIKTTAIAAAEARGWSKAELAKKTGLSLSTIYSLSWGTTQPNAKTISAIMAVFPDLPYERLFVPTDSTKVRKTDSELQEVAA